MEADCMISFSVKRQMQNVTDECAQYVIEVS